MTLNTALAVVCIGLVGFAVGRDYRSSNPVSPIATVSINAETPPTLKLPAPAKKSRAMAILAWAPTKAAAYLNAIDRATMFTTDINVVEKGFLHGFAWSQGMPTEYWVCRILVEMPPQFDGIDLIEIELKPDPTPGI